MEVTVEFESVVSGQSSFGEQVNGVVSPVVVRFAGRGGRSNGGVGFDLGNLADFVPSVGPNASYAVEVVVLDVVGVVGSGNNWLAVANDMNLFPWVENSCSDDDGNMLG